MVGHAGYVYQTRSQDISRGLDKLAMRQGLAVGGKNPDFNSRSLMEILTLMILGVQSLSKGVGNY